MGVAGHGGRLQEEVDPKEGEPDREEHAELGADSAPPAPRESCLRVGVCRPRPREVPLQQLFGAVHQTPALPGTLGHGFGIAPEPCGEAHQVVRESLARRVVLVQLRPRPP